MSNEPVGFSESLLDDEPECGSCVELRKQLAESQARIKVLEDALRTAADDLRGYDNLAGAEYAERALSTTSPSEALDKVVREAEEEMRERCAKVCESIEAEWDSQAPLDSRVAQGAGICAEAIRRIEP